MSDYYDLFVSLELRADLPDEVMHEIRWHLRLVDSPPTTFRAFSDDGWYADEPYPFFSGTTGSHAFDGTDVAVLLPAPERTYPDGRQRWLLTVRSCVHEDEFGYAMELTRWLAAQSTADGWIGYLGHTATAAPELIFWTGGGLRLAGRG